MIKFRKAVLNMVEELAIVSEQLACSMESPGIQAIIRKTLRTLRSVLGFEWERRGRNVRTSRCTVVCYQALGTHSKNGRTRDRSPAHSGSPSTMVSTENRRARKTLTKIDPATLLRKKPKTISQHAANNGVLVTTAVNPVRQPPAALDPLLDPLIFGPDASNFTDEHSEDDGCDDGSKGYHVARVCIFCPFYFSVRQLIPTRTTRSCCGGESVTSTLMNSYDSKAGGSSPPVNSAVKTACIAASIALRSVGFAVNA